ncbi:MAG: hypothetical protein NC048_10080 [Bacteroides sp.]|nr:hypothetical protein [Bacteroides sp.]MCM1555822.1 hypothetical protein [Bacteroides sp.]
MSRIIEAKVRLQYEVNMSCFIGQGIQSATQMTGAILQGIGAKKNRKKYDKLANGIQKKKADLQSMYKQKLATNYTSTAEGANAVRTMQNQAEQASKQGMNSAIRTGASPEAQVAAAGAMQQANANAISGMAAQGTARQDSIEKDMQSQVDALDNQYNDMKLKQIDASNAAWGSLASQQ